MNRPLLLLSVSAIRLAQPATADPASITNGADWKDTEGNPIVAHEGDIARFNGVFYWYGSSYANNPKGKFDIDAGKRATFETGQQIPTIRVGLMENKCLVESVKKQP